MNTATTTGLIRRNNARALVARLEAKTFLSAEDRRALLAARRRAAA